MNRGTGVSYNVERVREQKSYMEANLILLIVLKGSIEISFEGFTEKPVRGDVLLINPGLPYEMRSFEDSLVGKCSWTVDALSQILKGRNAYFYCNSAAGYSRWHRELKNELESMTAAYAAGDHQTDSLIVGYLYRVLDILIEHFQVNPNEDKGAGKTREGAGSEDSDRYMSGMMQYIMQNLHGEISLTELADRLYVSASTLSRVFKKQTGLYFADYVMQLRVKEAMALLTETDDNMTQIALRAGFSGSSAFSRAFKKVTGETPGEYRERIRQAAAQNQTGSEDEDKKVRDELLSIGMTSEDGTVRRLVKTDLNRTQSSSLEKIWNQVINIGEVYDLTKANVQQHCLYLRDHLHFRYARIWNLFSRNMLLTDGRTAGKYNFRYLDQVIDFLIKNQMKPFLDFGRRPSMAMKPDGEKIYFEETYTLFASRELWEEALQEILRHLHRKYGREEVSTWYFEFSRYSMHGTEGLKCYEDPAFNFFEAWKYAYRTIRREVPGAMIGGVSAQIRYDMDFLLDFYRNCADNNCIPDFCSYGMFPYTSYQQNPYLKKKNSESGIRSIVDQVDDSIQVQAGQIFRIMEYAGIRQTKIFVTEWNNTIANRDYFNDSCFRAAFFIHEIIRMQKNVDLVCVMSGTDWVSYYMDASSVVHGGIGLLTKDTIRKPAYFALEFLNMLGDVVLASDDDYILTRAGIGDYYLLCSHFVSPDLMEYPVIPQDEPDLYVLHARNHHDQVLSFRLSGVPDQGNYIIKKRSLSSSCGSILDEWAHFQFAEDLNEDDIRYLRERCIPEISMERVHADETQELSFDVHMQPEDIVLLHIFRDDR